MMIPDSYTEMTAPQDFPDLSVNFVHVGLLQFDNHIALSH
jgi:hypothetical protein